MADPSDPHPTDNRQRRKPEDLTRAEVVRIVGTSKNLDDAKLRLGLGPVTDQHLHGYLASKGLDPSQPKDTIQQRITDAAGGRSPWAASQGPAIGPGRPGDEKFVDGYVTQTTPEGFVKTPVRGTRAQIEQMQDAANLDGARQMRDGLLQAAAGMQRGSASRLPPGAERPRTEGVERAYKQQVPEAPQRTVKDGSAPKTEGPKPTVTDGRSPTKAEPKPEAKAAPKVEPKPEAKAAPKVESKPEAKTEAAKPVTAESKAAPKAEASRPAAKEGRAAATPDKTAAPPPAKDGGAGAKQAPSQRLIPDHELVTRRITAGGSDRGVKPSDRQWAKDVAARHGETGKVDVAHTNAHVFTKPGESVDVRPQSRSVNRAEGRDIARAAEARRGWNATQPPENRLTVRDKQGPRGAATGVDRAYAAAAKPGAEKAAGTRPAVDKPKVESPGAASPKDATSASARPRVDPVKVDQPAAKPKTETPNVARPPTPGPPRRP